LYGGQQVDPNTGLYNLRARQYDPSTGRFLSRDTAAPRFNGLELNRYVYTANNPVNLRDLSGHQAFVEYEELNQDSEEEAAPEEDCNCALEDALNNVENDLTDPLSDPIVDEPPDISEPPSDNGPTDQPPSDNNSCPVNSFSADTLVATDHGEVPIGKLKVGDKVLAYNETTGKNEDDAIQAVIVHLDPSALDVTIDGETIQTTAGHPFYTLERGWVKAGDLNVGEHVRKENGTWGRIEKVLPQLHAQVMYNLTITSTHNFFVGRQGLLVHNVDGPPSPCTKADVKYPDHIEQWLNQFRDENGRLIKPNQDLVNEMSGGVEEIFKSLPEMTASDLTQAHIEALQANMAGSIANTLRANIANAVNGEGNFESIAQQLTLGRYRFLADPRLQEAKDVYMEALSHPWIDPERSAELKNILNNTLDKYCGE
jgi:RHS repeat-associated protein